MPKLQYDSKAESTQFELLPDGDYCFEVASIDIGLRSSGTTSGSEEVEMKVAFYRDATFEKKVAQWTEQLIFHPKTAWKVSVFTKCANMLLNGQVPPDGSELDYSAESMIGLRGWCSVRSKAGISDATKKFNYVMAWLTNKEKLPRNTPKKVDDADMPEREKLPF